jgi:2-methylcitrate dehydratase
MMDATTERLADFACATRFELLSADAVHQCKRRVIDTVASAVAAFDDPVCRRVRNLARRQTGEPSAGVWGSHIRSTPEMAAFANGVTLRFMDISDTYVGKSRGHPSDVISGIMAAAETVGADGGSIINAITLAYDVYCSFIDAIEINRRGWDQPVYGVIATALGAGRLLGLSREQMQHAVALALAPNMALAQSRAGALSNWKGCAGANAARNGVFAALLAQEGFTGPAAVFEGVGGLWEVVGEFTWPLPDARGPHRIEHTHIKTLPVCFHGQASVLAAMEMQAGVRAELIDQVEVDTYDTAVLMMANDASRWAPATHETADHSMPYVVAIALLDGEVTAASFAHNRLTDPAVVALMQKIKVHAAPDLCALYPESAPGRVRVTLRSGEVQTREVRYPKGHAKNPLTDTELENKFRRIFAAAGRMPQCDAALDTLWKFDRCENAASALYALLRADEPAA